MKNWLILILILNLVLSTTLIGEEITLRTGEVVSFTKILKIEPDGLKLAYPDGIKKIRIEDMKEADQKKYDLKLDQAKAFREENLAAMKAADQAGLEEEAKTKQENDEAKAKAAKVPKIISAEQMKAVWIKNLPAPGTLDRDYQAKLRTYNAMIAGIRTGGFDNLAQERTLVWNIGEYQRVDDIQKAALLRDDLAALRQKIQNEQELAQQKEAADQAYQAAALHAAATRDLAKQVENLNLTLLLLR